MKHMLRPATPGQGDAVLEHVSVPQDRSFVWRLDDYPWRRSVWNYHPEVEIHLMRKSTGLAYVGDYIAEFQAGQLLLVGANLPHNFVTPGIGQRVIAGREIVVQFDPERLIGCERTFPELSEIRSLLRRASVGLEFVGVAARAGREILEEMGRVTPLEAFSMLLRLLALMAHTKDVRTLASQRFADDFRPGSPAELHRLSMALDYIQNRYTSDLTLPEVARHVGLSDSAFSRFFRAQTGNGFSQHVASLRIWSARRMISEGSMPITDICFEAGFGNISNFNRTFLRYTNMTPSQYRRALRQRETSLNRNKE